MKNHITLGVLLLLTLLVSLASFYLQEGMGLVVLIMGLAMAKLLLVAFQFMELKTAHLFWKGSIVFVAVVIFAIVSVLAGRP